MRTEPFPIRRCVLLLLSAAALGSVILAGCSDDDDENPPGGGEPTTTSFTGAFLNGVENGALTVTINSTNLSGTLGNRLSWTPLGVHRAGTAEIAASGILKPVGGGSIALTGTFNDQSDSLGLANSGLGYFFDGAYDTTGAIDAILGQYTGPNGTGFFGCVTGVTSPGAHCGTFDSDVTSTTGNWDLLVTGAEFSGIAFPTVGDPFFFEGTIETTGTTRDLTGGGGEPGVYQLTVTGTLDTANNTISGSWTYEDLVTPSTDSGTWTTALCPQ